MPNCDICHESFIPRQTFETLFTPETTCQSCRLDMKRSVRENHVPLLGNSLVVLTFDAPMKPAFFHTLMHKIVHESIEGLFYENIQTHDRETYRLLGALMRPVMLFHGDFMTLDKLQSIETMLEGN
ncbi:MAG: hypothetical protein ACQEQA_00845 [Bacillota bacterium]